MFHQGAVLIEGDVDAILSNEQVRDVYLGKQAAAIRCSRSATSPPATAGSRSSTASSFEVAAGEFVGILGHNGMGKTTLLQDLDGLAAGHGGQHPLRRRRDHPRADRIARARLGMGYVPQGREIFPGLSVRDNLRMGAASAGRATAVIDAILEDFPRLKPLLDRRWRRAVGRRAADAGAGALPLRPAAS